MVAPLLSLSVKVIAPEANAVGLAMAGNESVGELITTCVVALVAVVPKLRMTAGSSMIVKLIELTVSSGSPAVSLIVNGAGRFQVQESPGLKFAGTGKCQKPVPVEFRTVMVIRSVPMTAADAGQIGRASCRERV